MNIRMFVKFRIKDLVMRLGGFPEKIMISYTELFKYYESCGWYISIKEGIPIDKEGQSLPWYTYPAIEFIERHLNKNLKVFEYGSGFSTEFYSKRVDQVVSVEHNAKWFNDTSIKLRNNKNVTMILAEDVEHEEDNAIYDTNLLYNNDYIYACNGGVYDIIVIDGINRNACTSVAIDYLSNNGIIIFDNSDRNIYDNAYKILKERGFKELVFEGFGPCNMYRWKTSIFYRANNCFGI